MDLGGLKMDPERCLDAEWMSSLRAASKEALEELLKRLEEPGQ